MYPDFVQTCGLRSVTGIGGANCRHSYWPFIEGVMERTYTDEELKNIDPPPFEFEGKTYTMYEATQKQRMIERTIRKLKRERAAYRAAGLSEEAQAVSVRIRRLDGEYQAFSKAAGLPQQRERMNIAYTDAASSAKAEKRINARQEAEASIRQAIRNGEYPLEINPEKQARHMEGTFISGRSVVTLTMKELQEIINQKAGSGELKLTTGENPTWKNHEIIDAGREIGYTTNQKGDIIKAKKLKLHYSKTGIHAVPFSGGER